MRRSHLETQASWHNRSLLFTIVFRYVSASLWYTSDVVSSRDSERVSGKKVYLIPHDELEFARSKLAVGVAQGAVARDACKV